MMLTVGWSCMVLIMLSYILFIPSLLRFYHERTLNFVKCFFCIYGKDHLILIFDYINPHISSQTTALCGEVILL